MDKFGISKIVLSLVKMINREHGIQLSDQEAKEVFLAGRMNVYGNQIDLTEPIRNMVILLKKNSRIMQRIRHE